ncbi:MAG: sulfite exporter TauE/SafE family protein [Planctomycetes bacterium]|nr:sulfite exporter TauE/SafE family protein [Planctomycetota bacterium]
MTVSIVLAISILALAILYSSVGHAGASGYLAAMALAGLAPDEMKPTALVLNIFVASIGTYRFARAGYFSWPTLWPFVVTSIPLAYVGGAWKLPGYVYKPLVGVVLLFAAFSLIRKVLKDKALPAEPVDRQPAMPGLPLAMLVGGGIGLLSGLTGTGGGIFLSPLLILLGWADPKRTAAVSVVFVLLVSISGLTGFIFSNAESFTGDQLFGLRTLPSEIPYYIVAAIIGGTIGSGLGAGKLPGTSIRLLLGIVLIVASIKMFITAWSG